MFSGGFRRLLIGAFVILGCGLAYQNCAQSFRSVSLDQNLTQSCKMLVQEKIRELGAWLGDYDCESADAYRCEQRVFAPELANAAREEDVCFAAPDGERVCVRTHTREFGTAAARGIAGLDDAEFEPGGEFNRTEARCQNAARVRGVAAFEATGDGVAGAFLAARAKCRAQKEAP